MADKTKFKLFKPHGNVKKDIIIYLEERTNRQLKSLCDSGQIPEDIYSKIRSTGAQLPRLYGLLKCHKNLNDPPYRPILSMRNSYLSNLSIYLDQLLKPFLPSVYAVKDTFDFLDKIKAANLPNNCFLVSYDVVSLFTNVPLKDTIDFICSLIDFTSFIFNRRTLKSLLQIACCDVVFSFDETLYCQTEGDAIGSALGPIMAGFAMAKIESQLREQSPIYA